MPARSSARRPLSSAWPSLCAVCRSWSTGRLCAECIGVHAPHRARCRRCAIEVPLAASICGACLTAPPPFERTRAAVTYGYPWDRVIAAFKFREALDLAPALADLMAATCDLEEPPAASGVPPPTGPLLLPVPLGAARLRERGFNQAWELARRLARRLSLEADAELLLRIKDTPHQLALPPDRRAANVRGTFAVEPRRRAEIAGRHMVLVDDVMTTGATAAEASRVLLAAGASRVDVCVVARTPRSDDVA